jgi:MFS transporter, DHA1 family, inner membrane transport protein
VIGYMVGRNGWVTMTGLIGAQAAALAAQWALGGNRTITVLSICVSGFALAALSAALGARILEVAPHSSDMAAAGTSTAFNVGITAGAFAGSLLLPEFGVRSTALAGALFSLIAFAVVLAEPRLATRRRTTVTGTPAPVAEEADRGRSACPASWPAEHLPGRTTRDRALRSCVTSGE